MMDRRRWRRRRLKLLITFLAKLLPHHHSCKQTGQISPLSSHPNMTPIPSHLMRKHLLTLLSLIPALPGCHKCTALANDKCEGRLHSALVTTIGVFA
jgi:hypothetical protein